MLDHIYKIIERRSQFSSRKRKSSLHDLSKFTEQDLEKVQSMTKRVEPTTYVSSNKHVLPRETYADSYKLQKVYSPTGNNGRLALKQSLHWQVQMSPLLKPELQTAVQSQLEFCRESKGLQVASDAR